MAQRRCVVEKNCKIVGDVCGAGSGGLVKDERSIVVDDCSASASGVVERNRSASLIVQGETCATLDGKPGTVEVEVVVSGEAIVARTGRQRHAAEIGSLRERDVLGIARPEGRRSGGDRRSAPVRRIAESAIGRSCAPGRVDGVGDRRGQRRRRQGRGREQHQPQP
jgi:hypothetical protein